MFNINKNETIKMEHISTILKTRPHNYVSLRSTQSAAISNREMLVMLTKPDCIIYTLEERNFTVMHINIQSLRNKLAYLEVYFTSTHSFPDVLTEENEQYGTKLPGYQMATHFTRNQNTHGEC